MKTYHFVWKVNYQNETEYHVTLHGALVAYIEVYCVPSAGMEQHQRKFFNGDDADFDRNHKAAWGGARINWQGRRNNVFNRWETEIWEQFVAHLEARYADDSGWCKGFQAKHPDVAFDPIEPLVLPRPIYWHESNGWTNDLVEVAR